MFWMSHKAMKTAEQVTPNFRPPIYFPGFTLDKKSLPLLNQFIIMLTMNKQN